MVASIEDVLIQSNSDASWFGDDHVRVKGYAYDSRGEYICENDLAGLFEKISSVDELSSVAKGLNGLFCVVGVSSFGVFALTDRVRSIPLFYSINSDQIRLSESPFSLVEKPEIKEQSLLELKTAGYALGNATLINSVFQVEASSFICYSNRHLTTSEYYKFVFQKNDRKEYLVAKNELRHILDRCMHRMLKSIDRRPVAIPLSGGYDSRFIVTWLKKNGYNNVITFTYGRKESKEFRLAERVAKKLNVQWLSIPYTEEIISSLAQESFFKDYVLFASNASSMPFFQDYLALKEIKEKNLIPSNSIIVPGHSGDFVAGSHLMPKDNSKMPKQLAKNIFDAHHNYYRIGNAEQRNIINRIDDFFCERSDFVPYSVKEWWDFKERQAKFIVNSCRTYQFFGYDLRLPFFDLELLDFFRALPFEFKLYKNIYKDVLEEHYFKPSDLSFDDELQPTSFDYKKKILKDSLKQAFPFLKNYTKLDDTICYTEIADHLFTKFGFVPDPSFRKGLLNSSIVDWYINFLRKFIFDVVE